MYHRKTSIATKIFFPSAILLGLWIFFSFCSCQCAKGADLNRTRADDLELRVMSFNIRYGTANDGENSWQHRKHIVFDLLRNQHPDIVGLQEALHFQINEICNELPRYSYLGVGRDDGKIKGEFCALLYLTERFGISEYDTFWLSDDPEVPGSITWGNACTRICTWARFIEKKSGRAFYIFNLHLDHVSQPSREKSAVLLTQRLLSRKYLDPFVVTGDFNAGENNPVVMYLKGETSLSGQSERELNNPVPMIDTFRVLQPNATEVGTFHAFTGRRTNKKIDYILTRPGVRVLNANILHDSVNSHYPSDHFPIVATMSIDLNQ